MVKLLLLEVLEVSLSLFVIALFVDWWKNTFGVMCII